MYFILVQFFESYTYKLTLTLTLDDILTFETGIRILSDSAGRAQGAVLNKVTLVKILFQTKKSD